MKYEDFIDLNYKPGKNDLICLFRVEPQKGISIKEAAGRIASESSTGTWVKKLTTETKGVMKRIRDISAKVFEINGNYIKIAYPIDLFELGNMPQILSSIAGNIFGMKAIKNLRLEDIIYWPRKLVKSFKGPQFGIKGIRKLFNIWDRPLTATVPKPKVGLTEMEEAKAAYEAWIGGIDLEKSDENLASLKFNKFEKRIELLVKMREKAEKVTGEKKSFLPNITAETQTMIKRAELVKNLGGEYVMIDIITAGWSSLQTLRNICEDLKLAIHAHRAMHASFTRNPKHGISMLVIAKIARIIGVDQLHTGTAGLGKLKTYEEETKKINQFLVSDLNGINTVFPVASGGLHPGLIPTLIKKLGKDIIIQCGGGLWGHKLGGRAGAKAIRQAIEASIQKIPLNEYSKKYKELKIALEEWGYTRPI